MRNPIGFCDIHGFWTIIGIRAGKYMGTRMNFSMIAAGIQSSDMRADLMLIARNSTIPPAVTLTLNQDGGEAH